MPRFVVLEHAWNGIHWDFMLEVGGSLRTWALESPIEPNRDIAARALGDHRLAYLDYEGPISGDRGTVQRRDRGDYELLGECPDEVRVKLRGGQIRGLAVLRREIGAGGSSSWVFRLGNRD